MLRCSLFCGLEVRHIKISGTKVGLFALQQAIQPLVSGPELLYHIFVWEFLLFSSVPSCSLQAGFTQRANGGRFRAHDVMGSFWAKNFKITRMTAVHFPTPTALLGALEGRCVAIRSLLDPQLTLDTLQCSYGTAGSTGQAQFSRYWPEEAFSTTQNFLPEVAGRTVGRHRRPLVR